MEDAPCFFTIHGRMLIGVYVFELHLTPNALRFTVKEMLYALRFTIHVFVLGFMIRNGLFILGKMNDIANCDVKRTV